MIYLTLILSNCDTVYAARFRTVPTKISSVARIRDMLAPGRRVLHTLMLSDDDGDIQSLKMAVTIPDLNFTTACECTETWWWRLHLLE